MKKLFVVALVAIVSCQSNNEFRGIGGFDLGVDFDSLPSAKTFTESDQEMFIARKFNMSDKIGAVSDLTIFTQNGKITSVMFSNNEQTDIAEVEKHFEKLIPNQSETPVESKYSFISGYHSKDSSVIAVISVSKNESLKNGEPKRGYYYANRNKK